jgi:hypothetical protein
MTEGADRLFDPGDPEEFPDGRLAVITDAR